MVRTGIVDDFNLHSTKLKLRIDQYLEDRVSWFKVGEGVQQEQWETTTARHAKVSKQASIRQVAMDQRSCTAFEQLSQIPVI